MNFKSIMTNMQKYLPPIHKTRIKTLFTLSLALMRSKQLGIASIGREIEGKTRVKHKIKRVDRFLGNENIPMLDFYRGLAQSFIGTSGKIFLALDWTNAEFNRDIEVLSASLIIQGRSIPIYQEAHCHPTGNSDMTGEELAFVETVRKVIPEGVNIVFLMDRGFCKRELMERIDGLGCSYIARAACARNVKFDGRWYRLGDLGPYWKTVRDYGKVTANKGEPFRTRLVFSNRDGSKDPANHWYLYTNLYDVDFKKVIKYYSYRMRIEETFRDKKNRRDGLKLKGLRLSTTGRYNRLLLVFAYAYAFLTFLGIWAEANKIDRSIRANTSACRSFALWRLGHYCFNHIKVNWKAIKFGMKGVELDPLLE